MFNFFEIYRIGEFPWKIVTCLLEMVEMTLKRHDVKDAPGRPIVDIDGKIGRLLEEISGTKQFGGHIFLRPNAGREFRAIRTFVGGGLLTREPEISKLKRVVRSGEKQILQLHVQVVDAVRVAVVQCRQQLLRIALLNVLENRDRSTT